MNWSQRIEQALTAQRQSGRFRQRVTHRQCDAQWLTVDGKRYRHFCSNDYLGLSHHPRVVHAFQQGINRYGAGAGSSGHVTGHSEAHAEFEQQLAGWLEYPRAILFNSGYAANQAIVTALLQQEDRIVADKLSHASLLEAAHLSPATLRRFAHNQPQSLQKLLATECRGQTLVFTEGIFSMEGDSAPLAEIEQCTIAASGWLVVDDAHGIGVIGDEGRGSCWQQKIKPSILVVTFGKGFGLSGAAVLCDHNTAEYLLQFARHLIYTTAMPPAQASGLLAALHVIRQGDELRHRLANNIARFREGVRDLPYLTGQSQSAIQPLIVGEEQEALALSARLKQRGFWVSAIRPPTVPPATSRLRVTLSAQHQNEDIDALIEALYDAASE